MNGPIQITGVAWYRRETYEACLRIMADQHLLPRTFDEWEKKAHALVEDAERRGMRIARVEIDPKEFPVWCALRGLQVDAKARMQFANEGARKRLNN
jgi:hypothetical protein